VAAESAHSPLEAVAAAARGLQTASSDDLMQQIVDISVASIDGCTFAGVSTIRNGRPVSPVVSDPHVLTIDELQYTLDVGPCLEAMRGSDVMVLAPDLANDDRFQSFGAQAATQGCRAVLAHRLYVDSQSLGSLNLYSDTVGGFSDDDAGRAIVLAALASLALHAMLLALDHEGLREAVLSRDVIGQAKGILMVREGIDADQAFAQLQHLSQSRNIKLRDVAGTIVEDVVVGGSDELRVLGLSQPVRRHRHRAPLR
jgi:GAF domain-containing protein